MIDISRYTNAAEKAFDSLLSDYNLRDNMHKYDRLHRLLSHLCGCDDYDDLPIYKIVVGKFAQYLKTTIDYSITPRGLIWSVDINFPNCGRSCHPTPYNGLFENVDELLPVALDSIVDYAPQNMRNLVAKQCDKLRPKTRQTNLFAECF